MKPRFWLALTALACAAAAQEPAGPLAGPTSTPSGGPLSPPSSGVVSAPSSPPSTQPSGGPLSPPAIPPEAGASDAKTDTKNAPAELEGFVLNDSTGQPLRRAHIVLNPLETGLSAMGTDAGDEGHFLLRGISAGLYALSAERDGFLTSVAPLSGGLRMPSSFHLDAGQKIADLTFRLRPWAVMAGRVRYSDGEFGVGVRVELYRTDHIRGRSAYSLAASAITNDRGEFRIYGLAPGAYLIASVSEPPVIPNYREQPVTDSQGKVVPAMGYMTTFYPNTELMSQAVPVRVEYGQELTGLDLSLRLARKVAIRGRVISAVTGAALSGATITLERVDQSGEGTMPTSARASFDRDNFFQIPSVSPGSYRVYVRAAGESGSVLIGHAVLLAGNEDVDNLDVIAAPQEHWTGQIVTEGPGPMPRGAAPRIAMEPRSISAPVCSTTAAPDQVTEILSFDCSIQRDETYDVFADNLPNDYYLSAVRAGGVDVKAFGLPGTLASRTGFEVVLDSRGGRVSGAVAGADGVLWGGSSLMLIPDPPQRRLQDYRSTSADANGRFLFRGVAPGTYTLIGWLDQIPCDVYDPGGLDRCRAAGTSVTVSAGVEQNLIFTVRPLP